MPSDLVLNPDFTLQSEVAYDTIVTSFENGMEQRRSRRANSISTWTLNYKNRSSDDLNTILALFNAKKGQLTQFTWDNPEDSTTYTVRFKEGSLKRQYHHYGLWDFSFEIVQVLQ